jgi:hypothetical protein
MTVIRVKDKKDVYVSKESFWESVLSDTYMAASNVFVLWLSHKYFGNEWLPCFLLFLIVVSLMQRFKEKQISSEELAKLIKELDK